MSETPLTDSSRADQSAKSEDTSTKKLRTLREIISDTSHIFLIWSDRKFNQAVAIGLTGVFALMAAAADNKEHGLSMTTYLKRQAACRYFTGAACDKKTLNLPDVRAWSGRIKDYWTRKP